ncbi:hypothetical protein BJ956_003170 [Arthrobacter psychrochitiniphilus]|nr:hypothetical protein [Arthrobacter psychrochitiniphilus]
MSQRWEKTQINSNGAISMREEAKAGVLQTPKLREGWDERGVRGKLAAWRGEVLVR